MATPNSIFRLTSPILTRLFCRDWLSLHGVTADSHFRLQNQWFSTKRLLTSSSSSDDFTVSYLVNSCGLSSQVATEASHKVKLKSLEKPDSVLAVLKHYEFSDTQISTLVRRYPQLLLADGEKTLAPKLEFFCSIGTSRLDLAKTVSYNTVIVMRSLENGIIPCYNFLKSVVISDFNVVRILKHNSSIFNPDLSKNVIPNIGFLKELGMPQSCIAHLLISYASIVMRSAELFRQQAVEVKEMGFDPQRVSFGQAMKALSGKETWKRCQEAYRSWGWTDQDIRDAFRVFPLCMTKSEKKITDTMDFLVNKMGWDSQKIAKHPQVLCFSLEKRIIPRISVVKVLMLKGLVKEEKLSLGAVVVSPEKNFLSKYVTSNLSQVPQLLDVYQGKVDVHKLT